MSKITIITGKAASGKTQIAIEKSIKCLKQGKRVGFIFYEDSEREVIRWFLSKVLNKDKNDLTMDDSKNFENSEFREIFQNLVLFSRGFELFDINHSQLFSGIDKLLNCDVIVIDCLQSMAVHFTSNECFYIYETIVNFAKKYNKEIYLVVGDKVNYHFGIEDIDNYDDVINT